MTEALRYGTRCRGRITHFYLHIQAGVSSLAGYNQSQDGRVHAITMADRRQNGRLLFPAEICTNRATRSYDRV